MSYCFKIIILAEICLLFMHKNVLFLLKNCKNRPRAPLPDSLASGVWGLCLALLPDRRRLGALPPDPQPPTPSPNGLLAAEGFAPRHTKTSAKSPPIEKSWLRHCPWANSFLRNNCNCVSLWQLYVRFAD